MEGDEVKTEEIKLSFWTRSATGRGQRRRSAPELKWVQSGGWKHGVPQDPPKARDLRSSSLIGPRRGLAGAPSGSLGKLPGNSGWILGSSLAPPSSSQPVLPSRSSRMVQGCSPRAAGPGNLQPHAPRGGGLAGIQFGGSLLLSR